MTTNGEMMSYAFKSNRAYECVWCHKQVAPGDKVMWTRKTGRTMGMQSGWFWHERCFTGAMATTPVDGKSTQVEIEFGKTSETSAPEGWTEVES